MSTLLCDECRQETDTDTMVILILIDIVRTVCEDCATKQRLQGWRDLYPNHLPLKDHRNDID